MELIGYKSSALVSSANGKFRLTMLIFDQVLCITFIVLKVCQSIAILEMSCQNEWLELTYHIEILIFRVKSKTTAKKNFISAMKKDSFSKNLNTKKSIKNL